MTLANPNIRPLAPSWIQPLVPLLDTSLRATANRERSSEVTLTFNAESLQFIQWNEQLTIRCKIDTENRKVLSESRPVNRRGTPEEYLEQAKTVIVQQGEPLRRELQSAKFGSKQLKLIIKEGRLTGIQCISSIPMRDD